MSDNPKSEIRDPAPESPPKPDETIKETIESVIIAFVLAFVFRAFVVEAFVIPTGSMAPTLLGEHMRVQCADCGFHFDAQGPSRPNMIGACPMCGYPYPAPNPDSRQFIPAAGDRILVHKYIYRFSEPRRWDVVVFKNPGSPKINYIKRLIGLPNESLYLFEGNVYTAPNDPAGQPTDEFHIARKSERPKVQRAVWRPIYTSDYVPIDPHKSQSIPYRNIEWVCPWQPDDATAWDMTLDHGRTYRYTGQGNGRIMFTYANWALGQTEKDIRADDLIYGYNQLYDKSNRDPDDQLEPIEDVRLAAVVQPESTQPLRLELRTEARIDGPFQPVAAVIENDGQVRLIVGDPETGQAQSYTGQTVTPLHERSSAEVELWFVDMEASVWIDGRRVLRKTFDVDFDTLRNRPSLPVAHRPPVSINVSGGPAQLHHVQLDRDLYYSPKGLLGPARGALIRLGHRFTDERVEISADEFFCLGDNSPLSHDGRFWGLGGSERTNEWVRVRMFDNDPLKDGVVPRDLMMGRAFFVYWPAPYPMRKDGFGVLPNFGDMRFIH